MFWSFRRLYSRTWLIRAVYLVIGLIICQLIACAHLAQVNAVLASRSFEASLVNPQFVPHIRVLHDARSFRTLFAGALFLTLTFGSAVTLLSLLALETVRLTKKRTRAGLYLFIVAWLLLIVLFSARGFILYPTACLVVIPILLFVLDRKRPDVSRTEFIDRSSLRYWIVPLAFVLIWSTAFASRDLGSIRDRLLLPFSAGQTLIRFYYKYAFYTGTWMQSYDQKLMPTWSVDSTVGKNENLEVIREILEGRSHTLVSNPANADLIIGISGPDLEFSRHHRKIFSVSPPVFFKDPDAVLHRFSRKSDRFALFRAFTWISLLFALPVACCLLAYSGLRLVAETRLSKNRTRMAVNAFMLLLAVPALMLLVPGQYTSFASFQTRRHIAAADLTSDPVPSIACGAIRLLGRQQSDAARRQIRTILNTTTSWYLQDCAYKSLRQEK